MHNKLHHASLVNTSSGIAQYATRMPELELQTSLLRARAAKADSDTGQLAEARTALAAREQQLSEATHELGKLRELAQVRVRVCDLGPGGGGGRDLVQQHSHVTWGPRAACQVACA
jgi:hypothetical protein